MGNFITYLKDEILKKIVKIIENEDTCDCTDGREPTLVEKVREAVKNLQSKTIEVQRVYRAEKFEPGFTGSDLLFDFLRRDIDDGWPTDAKVDAMRGDLSDFEQAILWIADDDEQGGDNLRELVGYFDVCERLLSEYCADEVTSQFDLKKERVTRETEEWRKSCTMSMCRRKSDCDMSCRDDAILEQLNKFCVTMSKEAETLPVTVK